MKNTTDNPLAHLLAPRYCSITRQPMFAGWCVLDGDMFIKDERDAIKHVQDVGYYDLEDAYEDEYIYYTEWQDIPLDEWDGLPYATVILNLIDEMQGLVDTIRTTKYMTEVAAPYQTILNAHRVYVENKRFK